MDWRIAFTEAWTSLRCYRRRTLVTVISLAWGVACFVMLMSYGRGFDRSLRSGFLAVGQDLVLTMEGQTSKQAGGLRAGRNIRFDLDDVYAIREAVPLVRAISPEVMFRKMTARGDRQKETRIRAVWPEYSRIRNMKMAAGRWISGEDNLSRRRVAVLGSEIATQLFSGIPPVGEDINLGGLRFTVIGVLDAKLQIANYNTPDNRCLFIPYDTASAFRDIQHPDLIVWSPVSAMVRERAVQQVRATLASLHRFQPNDEKAVEILAFSQFLYIIDGMSVALQSLLAFVGALTLGIGGVGLANVMLASVIERTREIGVLKAIGSSRRSILSQFLLESLIVVGAGGALGIAVGSALTLLVGNLPLLSAFFEDAKAKGDLQLTVSVPAILISAGLLFVVGVTAGMIPAIKAARLNPIDALRYE